MKWTVSCYKIQGTWGKVIFPLECGSRARIWPLWSLQGLSLALVWAFTLVGFLLEPLLQLKRETALSQKTSCQQTFSVWPSHGGSAYRNLIKSTVLIIFSLKIQARSWSWASSTWWRAARCSGSRWCRRKPSSCRFASRSQYLICLFRCQLPQFLSLAASKLNEEHCFSV